MPSIQGAIIVASLFLQVDFIQGQDKARSVIENAIQAQGGEAKVSKLRIMRIKVEGTTNMNPDQANLPFTLEDTWQMPDQYKTVFSIKLAGMELKQVQVLDSDKGWIHVNGITQDLPRESIAEIKEQKHAEDLDRLGFLKEKGYELSLLDEVTIAEKPAVGVLVKWKGHRDVKLYFDNASGLLVKREHRLLEAPGKEVLQEVFFSDYEVTDGLKHYGRIVAHRDGKKVLDAKVTEIEFHEKLDAKVFAKPFQEEEKASGKQPSFAVEVTGKGAPMILIPGLTCSGEVWKGVVEHYKKTWECHVLTLAGFAGQPSIPPPFLETVRKDLARYILEKKLEKPVIVGHSLGAFLAFWLSAKEPELVGPVVAVDGVPFYSALLDPNVTGESVKPQADLMRAMAATPLTKEQRETQARAILGSMITDPKNIEMALRWNLDSDPKAVGQAMYELMTTDLREEVAVIRSPVLLIGAGDDEEAQKEMRDAYERQVVKIHRCKYVMAKKSKHFVMFDAPEFLLREMDAFLVGTNWK